MAEAYDATEVEDESLASVVDEEKEDVADSLAKIVQDCFTKSKEYRQENEDIWRDAWYAYRGKYPERFERIAELAEKRGIYINLTKRKVQSAKVRINSLLFEDGKIPFNITPPRRPKFVPPEITTQGDPFEQVERASKRMEAKIRDILDQTDYANTLMDVISDMCLYGTGITKSISLKNINYPIYKTVNASPVLKQAEKILESEKIPVVDRVSIWNLFPSPDATNVQDAEWFIQRSFVSARELVNLAEEGAYEIEKVIECIETEEGVHTGTDNSQDPFRYDFSNSSRVKKFQLLEMWGSFAPTDLSEFMEVPKDLEKNVDVVVTVLGDKVLRASLNPFEGEMPYKFCYWTKNSDSIWGDGIYYSVRDLQSVANYIFAQIIEGKTIASNPMSVIDPMAFEEGSDVETLYPGKQFRVRAGASVQDAFRPLIIPDVTNGLVDLYQLVEREVDLDSGQTAIGTGQGAKYQSRTATGMSILNTNANKLTSEVVRSISTMMTHNIRSIYFWLMADSDDPSIKGDYNCMATGYQEYVSKEIRNQQLLNFLNIMTQNPEIKEYIKMEELVAPVCRAFGLDADRVVISKEELQMIQQQMTQSQQQQMESQVQAEEDKLRNEALLQEKMAISSDMRKAEIAAREMELTKGNFLTDESIMRLRNMSILMDEERQAEESQMLMQEFQKSQQEEQEEQELIRMEQEVSGAN